MENIPSEVLAKIIDYLDVNSKVKCRLVSLKWKETIDNYNKLTGDLVISDRVMSGMKWSTINEPVDRRNRIKRIKCSTIQQTPIFIKNIRRLYINTSQSLIQLDILMNGLQQLRQLQIINTPSPDEGRRLVIELPELTHLSIEGEMNPWLLNSPNLHYIRLYTLQKIEFVHPTSIRHLELYNYPRSEDLELYYLSLMSSFVNLEYLYCFFYGPATDLNDVNNVLNSLINLKEFHLYSIDNSIRPANRDLLVYLMGARVSEPFDDIKNQCRTKFLCENYDRNNLANYIPLCHQMDYTIIDSHFREDIPSDFLSRFVNIVTIHLDGKVVNELKLIKVLTHFRNLRIMNISTEASLSQRFFNSLPNLLPQLTSFDLGDHKDLNLNFLLKLKSLDKLYLKNHLNFQLFYKLLSKTNFKNMNCIVETLGFLSIRIESHKKYYIHYYYVVEGPFESIKQVLNSCKQKYLKDHSKETKNENDVQENYDNDAYDLGDLPDVDSIECDVSDYETGSPDEDDVKFKMDESLLE